jgi:predicted secreted protein
MAKPTTLRGTKLLLKLGDGASPETFAAQCGLSTKSFDRSASTNEFNVADCEDPDAPIWTERVKGALSSTVSGSGVLAQEALDAYDEWYLERDSRNLEVTIDFAVGPRVYRGAYHLTTFNITGEQDGLIQVQIELQSDGEVSVVA